jgi:hypothetical protein
MNIEPKIHSHIEDCLEEAHPLAFEQVYCDGRKTDANHDKILHAANNECMQTWVETGRGNFCWKCFCKMASTVLPDRLALQGDTDPRAIYGHLKATKALVLYFGNDGDREGFINAARRALPNLSPRKL